MRAINAPAAGHACLANLAQGTVCKILGQEEVKPHKVRYYLERRDAEFEQRMAELLCVCRTRTIKQTTQWRSSLTMKNPVSRQSQRKQPTCHPSPACTRPSRDHEYKRHRTVSQLARIDLLTGKVHALVRDRHRSREFIEFLKLLDAAYAASTAIKPILDNHSAHISKETRTWRATRPAGRFEFTFTPLA